MKDKIKGQICIETDKNNQIKKGRNKQKVIKNN